MNHILFPLFPHKFNRLLTVYRLDATTTCMMNACVKLIIACPQILAGDSLCMYMFLYSRILNTDYLKREVNYEHFIGLYIFARFLMFILKGFQTYL